MSEKDLRGSREQLKALPFNDIESECDMLDQDQESRNAWICTVLERYKDRKAIDVPVSHTRDH